MEGLIVTGVILAVSLLFVVWLSWTIRRVFKAFGVFGHLRLARTAMQQLQKTGGVLDQQTVERIAAQLETAGVQVDAETLRRGTIVTGPTTGARLEGAEEHAARSIGAGALDARATVLEFRDLNVVAGDGTLAELKLRVEPHGRESYEVIHNAVVPRERLRGLVRGERVTVSVDPDEPERLAIDWSRS